MARLWRGLPAHGALALLLAGALLYGQIGGQYRIDLVRCADWPSLPVNLMSAAMFLLALVLMGAGWLRAAGIGAGDMPLPRLSHVWLGGLAAHLCVGLVPPFLSDDPLAYLAIGRAGGVYGADAYAPLGASLPVGDRVRALIERYPAWLAAGSTYGPGFNALAGWIARLAGDDLALGLRLFQLSGALALMSTAVLAGQVMPPGAARVRAVALVLLAPIGLIEATSNAHNDALLALLAAAFIAALARRWVVPGILALLAGLLVKASMVLLIAFYGLWRVRGGRAHPLVARWALGGLVVAGLGVLILARPLLDQYAGTIMRIFGAPMQALPFCTRSLECLPRGLLHVALDMPLAGWLVGLGARFGALVLLLVLVWRAGSATRPIIAMGGFVLLYYLFFHAYMQAWYLLILLPFLPFFGARMLAVALTFCLSALAQYAFDLPLACDQRVVMQGISEAGRGLVAVVPPLVVLWLTRARRGEACP